MHSRNAKRNECLHEKQRRLFSGYGSHVTVIRQEPSAMFDVLAKTPSMRGATFWKHRHLCASQLSFVQHVLTLRVSKSAPLSRLSILFLWAWSSFMLFLVLGSALQRQGAVVPFDDLARNNAKRCALSRLYRSPPAQKSILLDCGQY